MSLAQWAKAEEQHQWHRLEGAASQSCLGPHRRQAEQVPEDLELQRD